MTHQKKYQKESQDARRHDQQDAAHPDEKGLKGKTRLSQTSAKPSHGDRKR